jgi:quinol monooxygenase YgiN
MEIIMSNELAFYVTFHVKPERVDEWQEAALKVLNAMCNEDTFVSCYMHRDAEDANKFTLYERWNEPSREVFMKNQLEAKNYRKAYEEKLPDMLQSPRKIDFLDSIQEWHCKGGAK